jgi:cytoskeletal protein CcmA (bactofilin family)
MPTEASKTLKQTLVDEGTELKGNLKSACAVVVNGTVDGEIDAPEITITKSGSVLGSIKAKKLRSQGTLSGNVEADDVFISGSVRSNTVIKAKSLEARLGSEHGQLEVTFGECKLDVGDSPHEEDTVQRVLANPESSAAPIPSSTPSTPSSARSAWSSPRVPEPSSAALGESKLPAR